MKVKKLLPGGLLTASMRALVRAGQKSKQATVSDRMAINKGQIELAKEIMESNPKKFVSANDKLGTDVVDNIARRMAKNEKVQNYKEVLYKAAIDPRLDKRMPDFIDTAKRLDDYEKKNFDWKLDERVKEWINLLSMDEKIKFMNSLNDELLENLYVWRLGFNIPDLREDRITCLASV